MHKLTTSSGIVWKLNTGFIFNPQISFDLDGILYGTSDSELAIPGGYVLNKPILSPRLEVAVFGKNWAIGYGQRFNEGGSEHATGMLFVELRQ